MGARGPKPGDAGYHLTPNLDRLWSRTIITVSGCWEHQGTKEPKGYVKIIVGSRLTGRRTTRVHVLGWEEMVGPRNPELTLDHTCENKACWNPEHLEEVTNAENCKRRSERMTHCRRGHERNETNTRIIRASGSKQCRVCAKEQGLLELQPEATAHRLRVGNGSVAPRRGDDH